MIRQLTDAQFNQWINSIDWTSIFDVANENSRFVVQFELNVQFWMDKRKKLFKPHARQFALKVLNFIKVNNRPQLISILPMMIRTFPKELSPIRDDITKRILDVFGTAIAQGHQVTNMSKSEILSRDERFLVNMITLGHIGNVLSGNRRRDYMSKLDPIAIDCLLQVIGRDHGEDIVKLFHRIIQLLMIQTTDSVLADAFRAFEPLCGLLKRQEISIGMVDFAAPVLQNYIESELFAKSVDDNARLVFSLYQTFFDRFKRQEHDCSIIVMTLVRLDPIANQNLVEEILRFAIAKWEIDEEEQKDWLVRVRPDWLRLFLAAFCYHRELMFKIFDEYQLSATGKKLQQQGIYKSFATMWLDHDWLDECDYYDIRINIKAVCELLDIPVEKREELVKVELLSKLLRRVLRFCKGKFHLKKWKSSDEWQYRGVGHFLEPKEVADDYMFIGQTGDQASAFGKRVHQLITTDTDANCDYCEVLFAPFDPSEKKMLLGLAARHLKMPSSDQPKR